MKSSDLQRIEHINSYCEDIANTIARFGDDIAVFENDIDFQNSVSMSIMQIGELSIGLSDEFKDATKDQVQWGPIRAMRNIFAHGYASMDVEVIWETATKDVPMLAKFCETIAKI